MATKNPRLNVVLEPALYTTIRKLAKRDGISLSLKARDLIREAIEFCEDAYWIKEAAKREATLHKKPSLTHKQIWG